MILLYTTAPSTEISTCNVHAPHVHIPALVHAPHVHRFTAEFYRGTASIVTASFSSLNTAFAPALSQIKAPFPHAPLWARTGPDPVTDPGFWFSNVKYCFWFPNLPAQNSCKADSKGSSQNRVNFYRKTSETQDLRHF